MTTTSVPAYALLSAGECTSACLLARASGGACACRCGGEFHGALISAGVSVQDPATRFAWHQLSTLDLLPQCGRCGRDRDEKCLDRAWEIGRAAAGYLRLRLLDALAARCRGGGRRRRISRRRRSRQRDHCHEPLCSSATSAMSATKPAVRGDRIQAPKPNGHVSEVCRIVARQARYRAGLAGPHWRVRYTVGRDTVNSSARSAME